MLIKDLLAISEAKQYKEGDVVAVHQHVSGVDTGRFGTFNIDKVTPTQIHVSPNSHSEKIMKFNRKTLRGIGDDDNLMIRESQAPKFYATGDCDHTPKTQWVLVKNQANDENPDYYGVNVIFDSTGETAACGDSIAKSEWKRYKSDIVAVAKKFMRDNSKLFESDSIIEAHKETNIREAVKPKIDFTAFKVNKAMGSSAGRIIPISSLQGKDDAQRAKFQASGERIWFHVAANLLGATRATDLASVDTGDSDISVLTAAEKVFKPLSKNYGSLAGKGTSIFRGKIGNVDAVAVKKGGFGAVVIRKSDKIRENGDINYAIMKVSELVEGKFIISNKDGNEKRFSDPKSKEALAWKESSPKAAKALEIELKKTARKNDNDKRDLMIYNKIHTTIHNVFPDADPIDYIDDWMEKNNVTKDDINRAMKKHEGVTYDRYMADMKYDTGS